MNNIIYGVKVLPDGTREEDKSFIARKFDDKLMACFACTKRDTCEAAIYEECKFEKEENIVFAEEVK